MTEKNLESQKMFLGISDSEKRNKFSRTEKNFISKKIRLVKKFKGLGQHMYIRLANRSR